MSNIFDDLNKYVTNMQNENRPFWESETNGFSRVIGPDGEIIDEEALFKDLQQSDLNRLRQSEQ